MSGVTVVSSEILVFRNLNIVLACVLNKCHVEAAISHLHQDLVTQYIRSNLGGMALASILISRFRRFGQVMSDEGNQR
jgi:hypothetical protein